MASNRGVKLVGNLMTIRAGDETTDYHLSRIASDDGVGFEVAKLDEANHVVATYHTELYPSSGHHGCDCLGCLDRGTCRHIQALVALEKAGKIVCRKPARKVAEVA